MTRLYGRAPAGERVLGHVPQNYGQNVTMRGALGVHGLHAVMTIEGATDAEVFRAYVKHVLGSMLTPGDIVVMDNLRAHKAGGSSRRLPDEGVVCCTCPPIRPICRPSSRVGRGCRRRCAKPKRVRGPPSIRP
jgi:hypothetical protein